MIMVDEKTETELEKEDGETREVIRDGWELRSMLKKDILTSKSEGGCPESVRLGKSGSIRSQERLYRRKKR